MASSRIPPPSSRSSFPAGLALLLGLLGALQPGRSDEQVPLILWSSGGPSGPKPSPPPAGHIVEQQQLSSYLENVLEAGPRNVVLFLQDQMSVEDFTLYGGAFGNKQDSVFPNLEGALSSSSPPALVLPAVSWPSPGAVVGGLQDQLDSAPLYMDPETLSQLRLNASTPALLVFRLPYGVGSDLMSAKEILSGNDEVIGQVLSIMRTQSVPYTAIYTALRPSREAASLSLEAGLGGGRSLLQARGRYRDRDGERERQRKMKERESTYSPVEFKEGEKSCILMWAASLSVSILRSGRWDDHDLTAATFGDGVSPRLHGSSCSDDRARLVLNYDNVLGHRSFKLIFAMSQRFYKVSSRRWFQMDAVELEYDGTRAAFNGSRNIYAPLEFSYRCQAVSSFRWPLLVPRHAKDPANQWRVSFQDFQIQGFGLRGGEFSYASDCSGFFSAGIWMGLLSSLLLVLLLTYGLHMILQLRTMDRFDDPKGPAISVPQTD